MRIDEDWIPLSLVCSCVLIWGIAVFNSPESTKIAGDVIQFGFGAVAGYMSRNKMADRVAALERENQEMSKHLQDTIIEYEDN